MNLRLALRLRGIVVGECVHTQGWAGKYGVQSSEIVSHMREVFGVHSASMVVPDALVDGETGHVTDVVRHDIEAHGLVVGGTRGLECDFASSCHMNAIGSMMLMN